MRIYVATSYKNIQEAQELMKALSDDGHTITHDWTNRIVDTFKPITEQEAFLDSCGQEDYLGVEGADAVVLINHELARDAMVEFGMAIGRDQLCYVLHSHRRYSVFFQYAQQPKSIKELLEWLHIDWVNDG